MVICYIYRTALTPGAAGKLYLNSYPRSHTPHIQASSIPPKTAIMQFKTIFVAVAVALTSVNAIAVPEDVAAIVARDDYTPGVPSMPQAPAAQNVPSVDTMITDVNSATAEQAAQVSC